MLCNDGDACTVDACEPGTDVCLNDHPPVDCDDSDPCTTDTCDSQSGCLTSPIVCDDDNVCTIDLCSGGTCVFTPIDCGAGEFCDPVTGCYDPCAGVTCPPQDQCHDAGTCFVVGNGTDCSNPVKPDGTACDDGDESTIDDVCTGGVCSGTPAGPEPCDCCEAAPTFRLGCPSCPACEEAVCSIDSLCCWETGWDAFCALEAEMWCTCCTGQDPGYCE
jgi:hypothetical protein